MHDVTAIYWIKNEARYMPEWIEFHLLQGYDHFILYDNKSTDKLLEVAKPYLDAKLLEIRYYPPELTTSKNFWLAIQCLQEQVGKSRWLDFRSLDERTFCPTGQQVPDFLKDYEEYGGVAVAWEEFAFNGHITRPKGLLIENYTQTAKDFGHHIKTIVHPGCAIQFETPHNYTYHAGWYTVNENYRKTPRPFMHDDYTFNKIKAHHYNTLSEEEFNVKMNKGGLDCGPQTEDVRREQADRIWKYMHGQDPEYGDTIFGYNDELVKWTPIVREAIHLRFKNYEHLLEDINH